MTPNVLGLDLGLRHAGAAQIDQGGTVRTWPHETSALPDDATPVETYGRIRAVTAWAIGRGTTGTVLAVIEELPRGTLHGQHDERSAVVWSVVGALHRAGVLVALVNPVTMKHRITGDGHADKDKVRRAVDQLHPRQGLWKKSHDETDAAGLATLGVARLAAVLGAPWRGPWLDSRALNLESGFRWPRELHPTERMRPPVPMPMFEVPSR